MSLELLGAAIPAPSGRAKAAGQRAVASGKRIARSAPRLSRAVISAGQKALSGGPRLAVKRPELELAKKRDVPAGAPTNQARPGGAGPLVDPGRLAAGTPKGPLFTPRSAPVTPPGQLAAGTVGPRWSPRPGLAGPAAGPGRGVSPGRAAGTQTAFPRRTKLGDGAFLADSGGAAATEPQSDAEADLASAAADVADFVAEIDQMVSQLPQDSMLAARGRSIIDNYQLTFGTTFEQALSSGNFSQMAQNAAMGLRMILETRGDTSRPPWNWFADAAAFLEEQPAPADPFSQPAADVPAEPAPEPAPAPVPDPAPASPPPAGGGGGGGGGAPPEDTGSYDGSGINPETGQEGTDPFAEDAQPDPFAQHDPYSQGSYGDPFSDGSNAQYDPFAGDTGYRGPESYAEGPRYDQDLSYQEAGDPFQGQGPAYAEDFAYGTEADPLLQEEGEGEALTVDGDFGESEEAGGGGEGEETGEGEKAGEGWSLVGGGGRGGRGGGGRGRGGGGRHHGHGHGHRHYGGGPYFWPGYPGYPGYYLDELDELQEDGPGFTLDDLADMTAVRMAQRGSLEMLGAETAGPRVPLTSAQAYEMLKRLPVSELKVRAERVVAELRAWQRSVLSDDNARAYASTLEQAAWQKQNGDSAASEKDKRLAYARCVHMAEEALRRFTGIGPGDSYFDTYLETAKQMAELARTGLHAAAGAPGAAFEWLTGIPSWALWTGGAVLVGGVVFGTYKLALAAAPAVAGAAARRYLP